MKRAIVRFRVLFAAGFLLAAGTITAWAAELSGAVTYSGSQTGSHIRILAVTNGTTWSSPYATNIPPLSADYTLNVPSGASYWIRAFLDTDGDNIRDLTEVTGGYVPNPLSVTGSAAGIDIELAETWYDFDDWTSYQDWLLYEAEAKDHYRAQRWSGTNYAFAITSNGVGGSDAFVSTLGSNGNVTLNWRMTKGTGDIYQAWGILPQPGKHYRISFDARSDRVNQLLRLYWYNVTYFSGNPRLNNTVLWYPDAILLATNWQTYTFEFYLEHDDQFIKTGSGYPAPYFDMLMFMQFEGSYFFDNMKMAEYVPDYSLPELDNPGFERGFYGWGDESRWQQRGVGHPLEELAGGTHWRISTNNPHSGRACIEIELPPFTNSHWSFEPALIKAGPVVPKGGTYLLSYWQQYEHSASHFIRVNDIYSRRHSRVVLNEGTLTTDWERVVLPLYRYAEDEQNTNFTSGIGGNPDGDFPIRIQLGSAHYPWTRKIRVDDMGLREISEQEALLILTNGYTAAPAPAGSPETNDPYYLSTSLSEDYPWRKLHPTDSLSIPVVIERNHTSAPSAGTVNLSIMDFMGTPTFTQAIPFSLAGNTYSARTAVTGFATNGLLPEGLFNYTLSMPGTTNTASDRFFVTQPYASITGAAPSDLVLQFDRFDLASPITVTNLDVAYFFNGYDLTNFMTYFKDAGTTMIKLWVLGRSTNEIDVLEPVINDLVDAGYEPFIAIVGLSTPTNYYSIFRLTGHDNNYSEDEWAAFVNDLATRFQGKVHHWHLANEPFEWDAEDYLPLLSNTWTQLKAVDSNNVMHAFDQILARDTLSMISNTYAAGAAPMIDVVDYHCYYRIAEEVEYMKSLLHTVRIFEDSHTNTTPEGSFLAATNAEIWMSEYTPLWAKITPGNLVTAEEREWGSTMLRRMLMARAFDVKKFFIFNARPSSIDNSIFHRPLHSPGALPTPGMIYAAALTFAKKLTGKELKEVYEVNNTYTFGFGLPSETNSSIVATYDTAQQLPIVVAEGVPPFRMTRLDGSHVITNRVELHGPPVLLEPNGPGTYDWTQIFGTNVLKIR